MVRHNDEIFSGHANEVIDFYIDLLENAGVAFDRNTGNLT